MIFQYYLFTLNINAPSEAIDFIDKCLKKNPTERLGYNPQTGTIDYSIIKIHEFFKGIDFENLSFPYQQNAENIEHKQKLCKSFSAVRNPEEKNFKSQNLFFSGISKNLEAFSTMDSFAQSKSMLFCLIEFLREDHFNVINADKFVKVSEKEEPPVYFDEESHLNLQNNGYTSHQDSDVEEGKTVRNRENYCIQINSKQLNDIIEEPEEYQNNDRSSSINSHTLKRILSNEEFKYSIETCRKSKEEAASMKNLERYSRVIKCERVAKKGILFYNERVLTLIAAPRLTYLSNGIEKEIDLNPTTSICKPGEKTFEIINYYPTLKFKFRTKTEEECDEWVSILQKTILSLD